MVKAATGGDDMVKAAAAAGMVLKDGNLPLTTRAITVRTEKTGDFRTLSFADDNGGMMIQVALNPEVKKLLRELVTDRRKK